jgi:hypothetical protein
MIVNKRIYGILVGIFPVIAMMPPVFMQAHIFLLAAFGLFEFLREKYYKLKATNIFFGLVFLLYFISLVIHSIRVDEVSRLFRFGTGEYFFLLAPLVQYALSRASNLAVDWYIDSCKVTITLVSIWVIFRLIDQSFLGRVLWHSQLGAILLSTAWCSVYKESNAKFMVTIFITLLGIVAISNSGTRTSLLLLGLLNVFIVICYLISRKSFIRIIGLFFIVQSAILLSIFSTSLMKDRIFSAFSIIRGRVLSEYEDSTQGRVLSEYEDSTQIRLEIYKSAIEEGVKNFYTGYGYVDPISIIRPQMSEDFFLVTQMHTHLHSIYLDNFLVGGALQLMFLLVICFTFFYYFLFVRFAENNFQIKTMALITLVAYVLAGGFESMLTGTYECGLLVLSLCFLSSRQVLR